MEDLTDDEAIATAMLLGCEFWPHPPHPYEQGRQQRWWVHGSFERENIRWSSLDQWVGPARAPSPATTSRLFWRVTMALNVILICLVAVSALNLLLVVDLYGRSTRLAKMGHEASNLAVRMAHMIDKLVDRNLKG